MLLWLVKRCPTVPAVVVGLIGVSLIILGLVHPDVDHRPTLAEQKHLHRNALAELQREHELDFNVTAFDFGDGLGLAAGAACKAGEVLMRIPESLAISVDRPRSCGDSPRSWGPDILSVRGFWPKSPNLACEVERRVVADVARGHRGVTRLTGFLSLMVVEYLAAKGLVASTAAAPAVLQLLPDIKWHQENGLFAIDADELRVLGAGTSMANWREVATNETQRALEYIRSELGSLGASVSIEHLRWAYLVLHSYGHVESSVLPEDLELPSQVWFLWPLFLARPTGDPQHAVKLRHNKAEQVYEVLAPRDMGPEEELLFLDPQLTDATALSFRGLWLTTQHRAQLKLPLKEKSPLMQKYGCGTQTLNLVVKLQRSIDPTFLSCVRLLAASEVPGLVPKLEKRGWFDRWPQTLPIDQSTEHSAAQLASEMLQKALERLSQSNAELKQRFGSDNVQARPVVRVREVETMVVVSLLKSMQELALLSSYEYLFEALRDAQREQLS